MEMDMNDHGAGGDSDDGGDGEGVWSPDIEQCFREALLLFPPCGRRKHILQEEGGGKMYGRNELIARHIKMRTGKTRTRKQVSSHIQVLARRKAKAEGGSNSSLGMPSPTSGMNAGGPHLHSTESISIGDSQQHNNDGYYDIWMDRPIVTHKIRLVEFSAFIEHPSRSNYRVMPDDTLASSCNVKDEQQIKQADEMNQIQSGMQRIGVSQNQVNQSSQLNHYMTNNNSIPLTPPAQTHPLGSNHQLTAQFNQATTTGYNNNNSNNNNDNDNQIRPNTQISGSTDEPQYGLGCVGSQPNQFHQHQQIQPSRQVSSMQPQSITRHSYIKIDYSSRQAREMQTNNNRQVETIDINQIFDKFPELGGSEGLFQRGSPNSFFLVKFWADIHNDFDYDVNDQNSFFGYSSQFETCEPYRDITCSTKICSYGNPLVEKVEKIEGFVDQETGRQSFKISRSPMCDFMVEFIRKLRRVPSLGLMNSVLENFTALQVITSESSSEILLCLAYVFEILPPQPDTGQQSQNPIGAQYNVYKLTKD